MNRKIYALMLAGIILAACGSGNRTKTDAGADSTVMTGNDKDTHGCIGSAGYVWSEVQQNCIRPFETGIKVLPLPGTQSDSGAVYAAFIVFSPDSLKAELFLPGTEKTDILDRRSLPKGGYAWNVEDDDTKNVRLVDGLWVIEQRGKVLYRQANPAAPIDAVFMGSDGKSRRAYRVAVTFYPAKELAVVDYDGTKYDLKQYVTGSGYGYKNDKADLRGKGKEATLTFTDGLTLSLNQTE